MNTDPVSVLSFTEIISNIANVKTILGVGGLVGLSITGILPKVGFGRAITLGLHSKLFSPSKSKSVRKLQIQRLSEDLSSLLRGQYILVTGAKGVGKSCMIDTALLGKCGVVTVVVRIN